MFGNRVGWGISAVILIIAGLLARAVYQDAQPSAATGWAQKTLLPISAPSGVDQIIPGWDPNRDAGDFYAHAIDAYRENPAPYDSLAAGKPPSLAAVKGLKALVDATSCGKMDLFRMNPQGVVKYEPDKAPLMALAQLAHATLQVAQRNDAATAGRCYRAVLALGVNLYQDRVVYDELAMGEELMGTACAGLKNLALRAKDTATKQQVEQFDEQRLTSNATEIQPMWGVLGNMDINAISTYAGDWFVLSQDKSADPLWQVEGTLKLGQLKYAAARLADQKYAQKVLKKLADDASQIAGVRAAAAAGRDLTIEQYREIR